jgi:hypothetical protein
MARRNLGVPIWAGASIGLMLIGSFGPWVKGPLGISVSGTDGSNDGWIVVGAAVVAAFFLYPYVRYEATSRMLALFGLLAGLAGAATTIYDRNKVSDALKFGGASIGQVGWGLNVAMIASISLAIAAGVLLFERRGAIVSDGRQPGNHDEPGGEPNARALVADDDRRED